MKVSNAWRAKFESVQNVSGDWVCLCGRLTRLADSEELVCVPGDYTTGQSAPAPFYDTAERLATSAHGSMW